MGSRLPNKYCDNEQPVDVMQAKLNKGDQTKEHLSTEPNKLHTYFQQHLSNIPTIKLKIKTEELKYSTKFNIFSVSILTYRYGITPNR